MSGIEIIQQGMNVIVASSGFLLICTIVYNPKYILLDKLGTSFNNPFVFFGTIFIVFGTLLLISYLQ